MKSRDKVLIVDDSDINRSLLADMLAQDYELVEASNGLEAVTVLSQQYNEISLVLLDIVMPMMDGFEVLASMNKSGYIDHIPVIMISAETSSVYIDHAYDLGAAEYISRPFDSKVVFQRVLNTIKLYAKQRRLITLITNQVYEKEKNNRMMVEILSQIVEFRNGESGSHVLNINILTGMILESLVQKTDKYNITWSERLLITTASALHDIGKIGIDDKILNKPGKLTDEEFNQIAKNMSNGIGFFNPSFVGEPEQALRWVVDNQLSPSPLGRAAFAEKSLEWAVRTGTEQYLIWGAGYDTFAYRQPLWAKALQIFEVDHPATARDKQERLKSAGIVIPDNVHYIEADFTKGTWKKEMQNHNSFNSDKISYCSILGVAYYLSKESFESVISSISSIVAKGSSIIFDYPDENSYTEKAGERTKKQFMLAGVANEKMLACYSYSDIEQLLSAHEFLIYEHLEPQGITEQYFALYNEANPKNQMSAFDNTNYCLAVKQ